MGLNDVNRKEVVAKSSDFRCIELRPDYLDLSIESVLQQVRELHGPGTYRFIPPAQDNEVFRIFQKRQPEWGVIREQNVFTSSDTSSNDFEYLKTQLKELQLDSERRTKEFNLFKESHSQLEQELGILKREFRKSAKKSKGSRRAMKEDYRLTTKDSKRTMEGFRRRLKNSRRRMFVLKI
ncbi:hypothetical protein TWF694_003680 [Orbilia ellipsospora]|uniref:Uncharacterized protein n=1 Tax=Orbilia ellipsospora TaxID=2528407 RepID=A0AAV9WZX5_9PEZI